MVDLYGIPQPKKDNPQQSSLISFVLLEFAIILILIVGMGLLLNYYRVVDVTRLSPSFAFLPQNKFSLVKDAVNLPDDDALSLKVPIDISRKSIAWVNVVYTIQDTVIEVKRSDDFILLEFADSRVPIEVDADWQAFRIDENGKSKPLRAHDIKVGQEIRITVYYDPNTKKWIAQKSASSTISITPSPSISPDK